MKRVAHLTPEQLAWRRARERERYANDLEYRERRQLRVRVRQRERYADDPEYRNRVLKRKREYERERYANDPGYRGREQERQREQYRRTKTLAARPGMPECPRQQGQRPRRPE